MDAAEGLGPHAAVVAAGQVRAASLPFALSNYYLPTGRAIQSSTVVPTENGYLGNRWDGF